MQKLKQELNANAVGANCIRPHFEGMTIKKQKGITLIALIITIIVMLILVGVTINVVLTGGLFSKTEKATYQTKVSIVKEQLEIAKAVSLANNGGKLLDDYSGITVENLEGLDINIKNEYKNKIFVSAEGNVCYNLENVTDTEERKWLEEIGINGNQENKKKFNGVAYVSYSVYDSSDSRTVYLLDNGIMIDYENGEFKGIFKYTKNGNEIELWNNPIYILSEDYQTLEYKQGSCGGYEIFTRNENDRYEYSRNSVQHPTYKIYTNALYKNESGNIIITTDTGVKGEGTFEQLLSYGGIVSDDGKTLTSPQGEIYTLIEEI